MSSPLLSPPLADERGEEEVEEANNSANLHVEQIEKYKVKLSDLETPISQQIDSIKAYLTTDYPCISTLQDKIRSLSNLLQKYRQDLKVLCSAFDDQNLSWLTCRRFNNFYQHSLEDLRSFEKLIGEHQRIPTLASPDFDQKHIGRFDQHDNNNNMLINNNKTTNGENQVNLQIMEMREKMQNDFGNDVHVIFPGNSKNIDQQFAMLHAINRKIQPSTDYLFVFHQMLLNSTTKYDKLNAFLRRIDINKKSHRVLLICMISLSFSFLIYIFV